MKLIKAMILTGFAVSFNSGAFAASQSETIRNCYIAMDRGEEAKVIAEYANSVRNMTNLLSRKDQDWGKLCLTEGLGVPWDYDVKTEAFVTGDALEILNEAALDEAIASLSPSLAIEECSIAVAVGADVKILNKYATRVKSFGDLHVTRHQAAGERCLVAAYGVPWVYDIRKGRFVTGDEIEGAFTIAMEAERRAAEQAEHLRQSEERIARENQLRLVQENLERQQTIEKQEREMRVWAKVVAACMDLAHRNETAAYTNKLCVDIFLEVGAHDDQ